jgi:hypothetical protein
MKRLCVAMVVSCVLGQACLVSEVLGVTFFQVDFSSQANYSWAGSGALPGAPVGNAILGDVPFNIKSNEAGNQAWNGAIAAGWTPGKDDDGGAQSITMNVNVYGATNVFTLINTWSGQSGPNSYAWLTFTGSGGATYTKELIGNVDIRDYNDDGFTNSINGTTTTNVFWIPVDGSGENPGRLDMQSIALPSAFTTQTLTTIQLVDNGGPNYFQRVILDGVTVMVVPEPSPFVLLGIAAISLPGCIWRRRTQAA